MQEVLQIPYALISTIPNRLAEVDTSIRGPGEHDDQFPSEEVMPSHKTRLIPHSGIAPPFLVVAQAGVSRLHTGIPQEV